MSFYLDASVLLSIAVEEQRSDAIDRFFADRETALWVSEFASAEVASAVSRLVRMGNLSRSQGEDVLRDYDGWVSNMTNSADIENSDLRLATYIVRRFDLMLRAPDALHLAICRRLGATMATLDRRLASAARALDIEVAPL